MTYSLSAPRKALFGIAALLSSLVLVSPTTASAQPLACRPHRHPAPRVVVRWSIPRTVVFFPGLPAPEGAPAPVPPPPQPAPEPSPAITPDALEAEVLELTNEARARGAVCGDEAFAPAPPLSMAPQLVVAARAHSFDMGARRYFDHVTPEGAAPGDRMHAAGWQSGYTGENIYGGPATAEEVVDGWMRSPGHCKNIMSPHYRYIGVGYAEVPGSPFTHYWTQDFGG
jgi:uncharacterized protein YkwD